MTYNCKVIYVRLGTMDLEKSVLNASVSLCATNLLDLQIMGQLTSSLCFLLHNRISNSCPLSKSACLYHVNLFDSQRTVQPYKDVGILPLADWLLSCNILNKEGI